MSMGFGSLTTSFPYWPMTRIDRPCGVVTALSVSAVASEPGLRSVETNVGVPSGATLITATPVLAGGFGLLWGAMAAPADPATYAQLPAHAMLALPAARLSPSADFRSWVWPRSSSP